MKPGDKIEVYRWAAVHTAFGGWVRELSTPDRRLPFPVAAAGPPELVWYDLCEGRVVNKPPKEVTTMNERKSLHRAITEHLDVLDEVLSPRRIPADPNRTVQLNASLVSTIQELRACVRNDLNGIDLRNQLLTVACGLLDQADPTSKDWREMLKEFYRRIDLLKVERGA